MVDVLVVPGYPSDLTDAQWALLEPVVNVPGKRGRKFSDGVRLVIDGVLYITYTGCQWRCPWGPTGPKGSYVPLRYAWRVEVAHGRLIRSRRLARSFENTLVSATGWLQGSWLAATSAAPTVRAEGGETITPLQSRRQQFAVCATFALRNAATS